MKLTVDRGPTVSREIAHEVGFLLVLLVVIAMLAVLA